MLLTTTGLERLTRHFHLMQSIFPSQSLISLPLSPVNNISPSSFLSPTRVRSQSLEPPIGTDSETPQGPELSPPSLLTGSENLHSDFNVETSLSNIQVSDENSMVWKPYGSASSSKGNSKTAEGSSPAGSKYSLFSDSEVVNKPDELNQK